MFFICLGETDWQESIIQKAYYFKYREFSGIFTINDQMINSDNSIQINIKFTFTAYEYIIVYEYISYYPI